MGGVLAGALAFVFYARKHKLPVLELADAIVAPGGLAQGIGRLGCFAAGCCYGIESDAWCAVRFTSEAAHEQTGVPLNTPHPAGAALRACVRPRARAPAHGAVAPRRLRARPGPCAWVYLVVYGAGRGLLELWRGDAVRDSGSGRRGLDLAAASASPRS